jgi:hypothetical protein
MVQLYLRFKKKHVQVIAPCLHSSMHDLRAYSVQAHATTNKDILCRVMQHQLRVNETLISTLTALVVSACPPGVTIYSDI